MEVEPTQQVWALKKSEEDLKREIKELEFERSQINERLKSSQRRGGRPGPPGQTSGDPNLGAPPIRRGSFRNPNLQPLQGRENQPEPPAKKKRLQSAIVKESNGEDQVEMDEDDRFPQNEGEQEEPAPRPPPPVVPRVLPVETDEKTLKRNKRMFGSLLFGTLRKFQEEDKKLQNSAAYVKRNTQLEKAEQKLKEESEKLRIKAREDAQERRKQDLILRARVEAKAEEKRLDLLYLQWLNHHTSVFAFPRTKAKPSISFLPLLPFEEVEVTLKSQQTELEKWQVDTRLGLKNYCQKLLEENLQNAESEQMRRPMRFRSRVVAVAGEGNEDEDAPVVKGRRKREDEGNDEPVEDHEFDLNEEEHGMEFGDDEDEKEEEKAEGKEAVVSKVEVGKEIKLEAEPKEEIDEEKTSDQAPAAADEGNAGDKDMEE